MRVAINLSLLLVLVFIAFYANAEQIVETLNGNLCTLWKVKDPGSSCLLSGGREGLYYVRDCENESLICKWRHTENCDKVQLCSDDDPNTLWECGPWRKISGVTCHNKATGNFEQKWARNCVVGGPAETLCSNKGP